MNPPTIQDYMDAVTWMMSQPWQRAVIVIGLVFILLRSIAILIEMNPQLFRFEGKEKRKEKPKGLPSEAWAYHIEFGDDGEMLQVANNGEES